MVYYIDLLIFVDFTGPYLLPFVIAKDTTQHV
jgi:hypothetical protein